MALSLALRYALVEENLYIIQELLDKAKIRNDHDDVAYYRSGLEYERACMNTIDLCVLDSLEINEKTWHEAIRTAYLQMGRK